jgi:hypothetical protein
VVGRVPHRAQDLTADDVIGILDLAPHPEGGHFRETFRDATESGRRAASTAIYFLLKAGEQSHWHAVDAAEGWHFYAGDALLLEFSPQAVLYRQFDWAPVLAVARGHRPSCQRNTGKVPEASAIGRSLAAPSLRPSRSTALRSPLAASLQSRRQGMSERRRGNRDRKSTRLNSSH